MFSIEEVEAPAGKAEAAAQPQTRPDIRPSPRPPVRPAAQPAPQPGVQATPKTAAKGEGRSARCSDILGRASLGEPLTPEEQTILRRDC